MPGSLPHIFRQMLVLPHRVTFCSDDTHGPLSTNVYIVNICFARACHAGAGSSPWPYDAGEVARRTAACRRGRHRRDPVAREGPRWRRIRERADRGGNAFLIDGPRMPPIQGAVDLE